MAKETRWYSAIVPFTKAIVQKLILFKMKKLTREEMKLIVGGDQSVQSDIDGQKCNCNSADDCTATNEVCMASCSGGTGAGYCGCP